MGSLRIPELLYSFIALVTCFQFTKKSKLRVPIMILISIAIIVQLIGANNNFAFIIDFYCIQVAVSSYEIHKEANLRLPIIIFNITFFITQAIGFGFNIQFLKCYITPSYFSISLASIAISAIMAFMINYINTKYPERHTN